MLTATPSWELPFKGKTLDVLGALIETLPNVLPTRRWFGGKARRIENIRIVESIAIPPESTTRLLVVVVEYAGSSTDMYTLPVTLAYGHEAENVRRRFPQAVIASFTDQDDAREQTTLVYEAVWDRNFVMALLQSIGEGFRFTGFGGSINASPTEVFINLVPSASHLEPTVMKAEQSNTSVDFSRRVILKLYRRLEPGVSPDLEIGKALTQVRFPYTPPIGGVLEYRSHSGEMFTLGLLHQFIPNKGDAWRQSLEAVDGFFSRLSEAKVDAERSHPIEVSLLDLARLEYASSADRLIGPYLGLAECLGQRTAELHLALSEVSGDSAFAPEPLTAEYRSSRYASMVRNMECTLILLQEKMNVLSIAGQADARRLFDLKPVLARIFNALRTIEVPVSRIRCHGDYHLGQVLWTGADFMIIDFEGEPARPLAERRMKHPALLDVVGMVRSFHYVPFAWRELKRGNTTVALDNRLLENIEWAGFWSAWVSAAFLKGYLHIAEGTRFWPCNEAVRQLFGVYLIEKAMYELGYELNNRPDWVEIPLHGLVESVTPTVKVNL